MDSIKYVGLDVHRDTSRWRCWTRGQAGDAVGDRHASGSDSGFYAWSAGDSCTSPSRKARTRPGSTTCWCDEWQKLVVCNPRKNALLKSGSKSDAIDARKLAELLRAGLLSAVYHGREQHLAGVTALGRSYTQLTEDTTRVMGRLKAVFRSQAIGCAGKKLYGKRHREE